MNRKGLRVLTALILTLVLILGSTSIAYAQGKPGSIPVAGVNIVEESITIMIGSTASLTVEIIPSGATKQTVRWSTSNRKVATVSRTGLITGVAPGFTTITVITFDGRFSDTCDVEVPLFSEDFTGMAFNVPPAGWIYYGDTDPFGDPYIWVIPYDGAGGSGSPAELFFKDGDNDETPVNYDYSVATPSIDATGATNTLNLSFKYFNYYYSYMSPPTDHPYTITVEVSTNGGTTWGSTSFIYSPTADIYPTTANVDLSDYKGQSIMIRWRMYGYTYWNIMWDIDDIVVTGS